MEKNARKLLHKYLAGECTPEEESIIEDWYHQLPYETEAPGHLFIEISMEQVWTGLNLPKKCKVNNS